jgi:hypothetical protein
VEEVKVLVCWLEPQRPVADFENHGEGAVAPAGLDITQGMTVQSE